MNATFDPFGPSFLADPYPHFNRFLETQRVFYAEDLNYWVVSGYEDCRRALRDYETFSASIAITPITPPCPHAAQAMADGGVRAIPTLPNLDPPAHIRTRRIANLAFTARRVATMEDFVRALVREFVDDRLHAGHADVVAALTRELPALVIFHILGVPSDDVETVKHHSLNRLQFIFGREDEAAQVESATGTAAFWRYCEELANDRRRQPRDDFTSDLVHTPDASGAPLSQQEVATILFGLLLAGHETTTNLLGNGLRRLLEHREAWDAIGADPTLLPNAIEEILRYDSSVIHWRRKTTRPVTLSGVEIPAGANVLVCLGAANRDPEHFEDPNRFESPGRTPKIISRSGRALTFAWARRSRASRPASSSKS